MKRRKHLVKYVFVPAVLIIGALLFPLVVQNAYIIRVANMVFIYAMLALSVNLITGFVGQLHLGHAAFYTIGAYTAAILATKLNIPFLIVLPAAGVVSLFFGIILSVPGFRLGGDFFCVVTIGFCEIVRAVVVNWVTLTRGPFGIVGIPAPEIFNLRIVSREGFYYLFLAFVVLEYFVLNRVIRSPVGKAMIAIREDELAASIMGVRTKYYKMIAFAIGAFFAGIAGCFFAYYTTCVSPELATIEESILIIQMAILGGLGSFSGSVLGAAILVIFPELLRPLYDYRMLWIGALMIGVILLRPQGILGTVNFGRLMKGKIKRYGIVKESVKKQN